jgi:hypothetical protein
MEWALDGKWQCIDFTKLSIFFTSTLGEIRGFGGSLSENFTLCFFQEAESVVPVKLTL